jgi:hypothetical protein
MGPTAGGHQNAKRGERGTLRPRATLNYYYTTVGPKRHQGSGAPRNTQGDRERHRRDRRARGGYTMHQRDRRTQRGDRERHQEDRREQRGGCWDVLPQGIAPVTSTCDCNSRPLPVTAACNGRQLPVTAACNGRPLSATAAI